MTFDTKFTFKVRIRPTVPQIQKINSTIFTINQVYNFLIETLHDHTFQQYLISLRYGKMFERTDGSQVFLVLNKGKIRNELKPLLETYFQVRDISIKRLSKPIQLKVETFLNNFNKINLSPRKQHKFKQSRKDIDGSFETDSSIEILTTYYENTFKQQLKLGLELFDISDQRRISEKTFSISKVIIKRKNGKYYASIIGEKTIPLPILDLNKFVGIDLNFENITLSKNNRETVLLHNLQLKLNLFTERLTEKQVHAQRLMDEMFEFVKEECLSSNIPVYKADSQRLTVEAKTLYRGMLDQHLEYKKLRKQIANLYEKRTNVQDDLYKKLARRLNLQNDLLFLEDLDIQNMVNGCVSNANLYNAALGKLSNTIVQKASTIGKVILKVPPENTSKICSSCGYIHDLHLSVRRWFCPDCHVWHDRDENASDNIEFLGLAKLRELSIISSECLTFRSFVL